MPLVSIHHLTVSCFLRFWGLYRQHQSLFESRLNYTVFVRGQQNRWLHLDRSGLRKGIGLRLFPRLKLPSRRVLLLRGGHDTQWRPVLVRWIQEFLRVQDWGLWERYPLLIVRYYCCGTVMGSVDSLLFHSQLITYISRVFGRECIGSRNLLCSLAESAIVRLDLAVSFLFCQRLQFALCGREWTKIIGLGCTIAINEGKACLTRTRSVRLSCHRCRCGCFRCADGRYSWSLVRT